jgi:hypothetical protein
MQTEIEQTMFGESCLLSSLFVFVPEEFALVVKVSTCFHIHHILHLQYFRFFNRSSIYKETSQLEDEAPIPPQQYQNRDKVQHFKEHNLSPRSFRPDTATQQFVMSYNKTAERRPDDLVEMTTYTVEPSMEYVIDSRNLSHGPETNHISRFDNDTMAKGDNEKNTSSASVSVASPESEFAAGQKQQSPSWPPISGSVSANENHTDIHSTCSSPTPPDYAFLRVSDVDVLAQPIKLQPSGRHQSNLPNKKANAARDVSLVNQFIPTSVHTTLRSSAPQADKKGDADSNPISASAAMKEAMEFAEARLKAAKELLERKGDSFKLRKKPSHHRSTRSTEIKAPLPAEVDTSKQKLSVKKSLEEEKNVDDSLSDKNKKSSASILDHTDEGVLPLKKQMTQRCTESYQTSSKIEKLGNWRSGDEFYELTGDEQKFQTDKATGGDNNSKRTSVITGLSNDMKSENVFSATDPDMERYEKLWEVNDGMDVGVKHANLSEDNTASVGKESVILETSTENMAHLEIHSSKFEGLVTQESDKESYNGADDECVEPPSMIGTPTKLDSTKDMSGSLSEADLSGNHASVLGDLGNCSPNVSPVSGTSQEHTNSKLVPEVPCEDGVQYTSGGNEQSQETAEVSNPDISRLSNIKSLILEELGDFYVSDAAPRGLSTVDQEVETYGREKFSFISKSFLHNKNAEIKEVPPEEVEKVENRKKDGPCAHPDETDIDLNAECPQESNITSENKNMADCEESNMLNVFEVASKLIKRDLDQETQESSRHGKIDSRMEDKTNGFVSDLKNKEAEEIPSENGEKCNTEKGSNLSMKSSESTVGGQSDLDAKCNPTVEKVVSGSFSGAASDSTSTTTITPQDEAASSSEMYTPVQHSVQKDESATSQISIKSASDVKETGEVSCKGERELPGEKFTCEENKNRANKMEENYTTSRVPKAEHGPSPLEKTHSLPKSAEGHTVSAEAMKKESLGVRRGKERDNVIRTENTSEKDKMSSQRTEEAKETERRSQKERELAEEKERRKLEEERERERKKDRLAVERATREAHERAFAEAREKAEKMAFERRTAARQRSSAEAREKEERANAEARIKAERAAVERATAEARERAIEKAKVEKAIAEARERRERYRSSFKERSTNQVGDDFWYTHCVMK